MSSFREPTFVLISIVAFLVLAVVATVEYSGNAEKAAAVKEGGLYRTAVSLIDTVDSLFITPTAIRPEETVSNLSNPEDGNNVLNKVKEYIQIQKTDTGWELTLQNKNEIIFQKTIGIK
jgi:hypothetical protein